jgi:hypothetical protein
MGLIQSDRRFDPGADFSGFQNSPPEPPRQMPAPIVTNTEEQSSKGAIPIKLGDPARRSEPVPIQYLGIDRSREIGPGVHCVLLSHRDREVEPERQQLLDRVAAIIAPRLPV